MVKPTCRTCKAISDSFSSSPKAGFALISAETKYPVVHGVLAFQAPRDLYQSHNVYAHAWPNEIIFRSTDTPPLVTSAIMRPY